MRKRKKPIKFLLLSILSFLALIYIIFFIPPSYHIQIFSLQLPIVSLFLLSLFLFCFSLPTYLFKNRADGLLISIFAVSIFVFRLTNLTHPFFFILLVSLFLTLELLFTYKK